MSLHRTDENRGTVVLMALCFVTVLGIGLAYFLSLSVQAMKFSNRSYVDSVSKMQAEMGLELALAAINSNDWSAWTISGSTATRMVTFTKTKYGSSGLTSSIALRIDNYKAYISDSSWNSTTTYRPNTVVGRSGMWYRSIALNSNSDPQYSALNGSTSTSFNWMQEQAPLTLTWSWDPNVTYKPLAIVYYNGYWYSRLNTATVNPPPTSNTDWLQFDSIGTSLPSLNQTVMLNWWNGSVWQWWYWHNNFWTLTNTNSGPFLISPQWNSNATYSKNDKVFVNGTWYVYTAASSGNSFPDPLYWTAGTTTTPAAISSLWAYSSTQPYKLNDVVYSGGRWYRCIQTNTNQAPPNTTYWSNAPLLPVVWDASRQYAVNDIVYYNGLWYRGRATSSNQPPPTTSSSSSYWYTTKDSAYQWSSATAYAAGTYVSYDGIWYRSKSASTGQSPINSTYWTAQVSPVLYVQSTLTPPDNSKPMVTQVRATLAKAPLFPNAVAASSTLSITNGGTVDSYNSSLGTYASQTPGYSAVLAAGNTSGTAVTMVGTLVKGYVAAPPATDSPFAPLWSYDAGANLIGPASSVTMDLTRVSPSPSIPQFEITAVTNPNNNSPTMTAGVYNPIGQAGATTPTVYTINGDLTLSSSSNILTINGPVILEIKGDITIGSGSIVITTTGSAEIHFSGTLKIQSGSGIDNQTLDPKKLILIGTANSGSHNFSSARR